MYIIRLLSVRQKAPNCGVDTMTHVKLDLTSKVCTIPISDGAAMSNIQWNCKKHKNEHKPILPVICW